MASIAYTKKMFCERLSRHINDGWEGNDFKITTNELCLYIDAGIPYVMKGGMYENVKVTGVFEVPEAYLVTYQLTGLTKNAATNEWVATLPQTPLALPTGYNITDAYISESGFGRGQSVFINQTKRVPYRNNLPKPSGVFARVEYNKMYLQSYNGASLANQILNVQMPISRTDSLDEPMNLPDDAIQPLFDYVIKQVMSRYSLPKDIVADNLPSGNKSS